MLNQMLKSTLVLSLVCLIAAALLGTAYIFTEPGIEEQKEAALKESLGQVHTTADDFEAKDGYFVALKNSKIIGYAAVAEAQGYGGTIKILAGIDTEKKLTGIRIMEHEETPGMGASALKPEFYSQFSGLPADKIALRRNGGKIDAITGATITSSAVIDAVKQALESELSSLKFNNSIEEADSVTYAVPGNKSGEIKNG
ncbi:RnfABCDGE type electron transport complex subunit G [Candidatus Woesearchaeota archaeon]|nr:RnfABCDGE type electron transport complex subunit G [Candidatus Woesearchaeota archaeon]